MEAVWVGAREPHEPGTDDYELWYARVELAMLKYLPDFELRRLSPIKHTDQCKYQLPTDWKKEKPTGKKSKGKNNRDDKADDMSDDLDEESSATNSV